MERRLPPETWGDRLHRAYRIGRRREGTGFNYREVARRVSLVMPTNDAAVIRLEALEARPQTERARTLAILCLAVYGFDGGALDIDVTTVNDDVYALRARLLDQLALEHEPAE